MKAKVLMSVKPVIVDGKVIPQVDMSVRGQNVEVKIPEKYMK